MLDNLTRILLEKYQPRDPRLFEVEEPVQLQKGLKEMPDELKALIASEIAKAAKRKKEQQ